MKIKLSYILSFLILIIILSACSSKERHKEDYTKKLKEIVNKWNDANEIASSTSRIALSEPVARLQEIKREAESIEIADKKCQEYLLGYMDFTIKGYLAFMTNNERASGLSLKFAHEYYFKWLTCLSQETRETIGLQDIYKELEKRNKQEEWLEDAQKLIKETKEYLNQQNKESMAYFDKLEGACFYKLQGVVVDEKGKNSAIINNSFISEGETKEDITIKKVNKDYVVVIIDGEEKTVRVGEVITKNK
ncbi:MAG: hypothetical protein PHP17_00370 [Candidatus Omnitrophica bacterium]|nr:hypothetical protein [Candidatus Omnitrophota bacterium]